MKTQIESLDDILLPSFQEAKESMNIELIDDVNEKEYSQDEILEQYASFGIHSEEELLAYLQTFEYGFRYRNHFIPYGIHSYRKNVNCNYQNPQIVRYLKEMYQMIPKELQDDANPFVMTSNYLIQKHFKKRNLFQVLKEKLALPFEIVELASCFLRAKGYEVRKYYFDFAKDSNCFHYFLAFQKNQKWYYFESMLTPFVGIYEFSSLAMLEKSVYTRLLLLFSNEMSFPKLTSELSKSDQDVLSQVFDLRKRAFYNLKISRDLTEKEDQTIAFEMKKQAFCQQKEAQGLLNSLPTCYEFYRLICYRDIDFQEYTTFLEWLDGEEKISSHFPVPEIRAIYEKQILINRFVMKSLLIPGDLFLENGIYTFRPICLPSTNSLSSYELWCEQVNQTLNQHIFQLGFFTRSVDRSAFYMDEEGNFFQIKGIDRTVSSKGSISFMGNDRKCYPLQASHFSLRFRGACFLDELSKEEAVYRRLSDPEHLFPEIISVTEFPYSILEKFQLPYRQELMKDYLNRISLKNVVSQELIRHFDEKYPMGIQFAQQIRKVQSCLRISDLAYLQADDFISLSFLVQEKSVSKENYCIFLAKTLAKVALTLYRSSYALGCMLFPSSVTLAGELCDLPIFNFRERLKQIQVEGFFHGTKKEQIEKMERAKEYCLWKAYFQILMFVPISSFVETFFPNQDFLKVMLSSYLFSLKEEGKEYLRTIFEEMNLFDIEKHFYYLYPELEKMTDNEKRQIHRAIELMDHYVMDSQCLQQAVDHVSMAEFQYQSMSHLDEENKFSAYLVFGMRELNLSYQNVRLYEELCQSKTVGSYFQSHPETKKMLQLLQGYPCQSNREYLSLVSAFSKGNLGVKTAFTNPSTALNYSGKAKVWFLILGVIGTFFILVGIILTFLTR